MNRAWRLDGARALITGGSSGIGLAVAHELAALGAELVLVARGQERLERARSAVLEHCPACRIEVIAADVSLDEDRQRIAAEAGRPRGRWRWGWIAPLAATAAALATSQTAGTAFRRAAAEDFNSKGNGKAT